MSYHSVIRNIQATTSVENSLREERKIPTSSFSLLSLVSGQNEGDHRLGKRDALQDQSTMTLQNNNDTKARTKQTTLSSTLVRCLCVTIAFVTTGLALLAFGLTCFLLRVFDGAAAPCPHTLTLIVFGVSGGLLGLGLVLLLCVCRRKKRLTKEALLDDLPEVCSEDAAQYRKKMSVPGDASQESHEKVNGEDVVEKDLPPPLEEHLTNNGGDTFDLTQKSADVSYWIEQQKSEEPTTSESFSLETTEGITRQITDGESSEGEMTSL